MTLGQLISGVKNYFWVMAEHDRGGWSMAGTLEFLLLFLILIFILISPST